MDVRRQIMNTNVLNTEGKKLSEFVFAKRIKLLIKNWMDDVEHSGVPLFLHGVGGCGKTSVSNTIAKILSGDNRDNVHFINLAVVDGGTTAKKHVEDRVMNSRLQFSDNDLEIVVLDEFHNLRVDVQDKYKELLSEQSCLTFGYRVIVIGNTDSNYHYSQVVSQPIRSRCLGVSFHYNLDEHNEVCRKLQRKLQYVEKRQIEELLPDVRSILKLERYQNAA